MKKLHIHIAVSDLQASIRFYSAMFAAEPDVIKGDYAKWDVNDPAVNFAISNQTAVKGLNHLGWQLETEDELQEVTERFKQAGLTYTSEENTSCCYARSDKHWLTDPQGIAWESFYTFASADVMSEPVSACCVPLHSDDKGSGQDQPCCISNNDKEVACC